MLQKREKEKRIRVRDIRAYTVFVFLLRIEITLLRLHRVMFSLMLVKPEGLK